MPQPLLPSRPGKPSWSRLTAPATQALREPALSPSSQPVQVMWGPLSSSGASNTRSASAPSTFKEQRWGCLASLNPGAGPVAAPHSPLRGNRHYLCNSKTRFYYLSYRAMVPATRPESNVMNLLQLHNSHLYTCILLTLFTLQLLQFWITNMAPIRTP